MEWRCKCGNWTMQRTGLALLALLLASCSELGERQGMGGQGVEEAMVVSLVWGEGGEWVGQDGRGTRTDGALA